MIGRSRNRYLKLKLVALRGVIRQHGAQTVTLGGLKLAHLVPGEPTVTETWCSRHGAFTVRFKNDGTGVSTSGPHGVRIVPPWQRWWKAILER